MCQKRPCSSLLSPPSSHASTVLPVGCPPPPCHLPDSYPDSYLGFWGLAFASGIFGFGFWRIVSGTVLRLGISSHVHVGGIVSARTFITMCSITLMGKLEHLEHERIHVFIVLILALPLSRESRKCSPLVDGRSP